MGLGGVINNQPTVSTPFFATMNEAVYVNGAIITNQGPKANQVAVWPFYLPVAQVITNITVSVTTSGAATTNDWGIYDTAGNLLAHIGAQTITATGVKALTAPITLPPGTYLFAITSSAATIKYNGMPAGTGLYIYDTATVSTGGALPTSIVLTSTAPTETPLPSTTSWGVAGQRPLFMFT